MDLKLGGKTVLITGASKGIGRAAAISFAAEGCHLQLVARTEDDLKQLAAEISSNYQVKTTIYALDISGNGSSQTLFEKTGTPDILINNAGAIPAGDLQTIDEARWRQAWDLKVFGYINMCRTYYDAMCRKNSGVIVNVTGLAADRTDADYIAGTTGNAGLNAFTRALGSRSLRDGIRVLAVSPGAVATERLVNLMKTRSEAEFGTTDRWQSYLSNLPLSRAAEVEEVADVITFMASERASYISGTIVTVDGGHGANNGSFT
ncbi:short-chain dehydrogenase/reductase [Sneathiella glossodoripedis]|uniref:short-chain dehydrogenase/reductase n=1 Tax=Sneathiella glossodoripedis TaxID=418853 RepID=UPI0004701D4D|nr:short-chain dehydrogenase/reductase [Sneathiella glossodoripedis]